MSYTQHMYLWCSLLLYQGNGRPFALEILYSPIEISQLLLKEIASHISSGNGLNTDHDIEVLDLSICPDRSVWESMQIEAEEKHKGYSCIVWCAQRITEDQQRLLTSLTSEGLSRDTDDEGKPCITVGTIAVCIWTKFSGRYIRSLQYGR